MENKIGSHCGDISTYTDLDKVTNTHTFSL